MTEKRLTADDVAAGFERPADQPWNDPAKQPGWTDSGHVTGGVAGPCAAPPDTAEGRLRAFRINLRSVGFENAGGGRDQEIVADDLAAVLDRLEAAEKEVVTLRQEASTGEEYRDVLRAERDQAVKQVKAHCDNARQAESQRDVAVNATEAVLVAFKQLERDLAQTKALYSDMYDQFLASQRALAAARATVDRLERAMETIREWTYSPALPTAPSDPQE